MSDFRIVPDSLREREPLRRGRPPESPLAKALLAGQTVFIPGTKKGWGNLYKLAANNEKSAHTKKTLLNDEVGTLVWFEDLFVGGPKSMNSPPPFPPKDRG